MRTLCRLPPKEKSRLEDGSWLAGTYEWSFEETNLPFLTIRVAGTEEPIALRVPERATLRWSE